MDELQPINSYLSNYRYSTFFYDQKLRDFFSSIKWLFPSLWFFYLIFSQNLSFLLLNILFT